MSTHTIDITIGVVFNILWYVEYIGFACVHQFASTSS